MQQQPVSTHRPVLPVIMATPGGLDCAWCLAEQGIPAGEGSHGICTLHKTQVLVQHRAIRAARQAKRGDGI